MTRTKCAVVSLKITHLNKEGANSQNECIVVRRESCKCFFFFIDINAMGRQRDGTRHEE
jgi:hypothetical protein